MATPPTKKKGGKNQSAARKWKRSKGEDLELPSGEVALVKRPGMEVFLQEGLIPDALMPIVNEAIANGTGLTAEKTKSLSKDLSTVLDMMDSVDRVTARVVIEPKVLWHKRFVLDAQGEPVLKKGKPVVEEIPDNQRVDDEDVFYTDDVDLEDKMFIFQFAVGGTRDLEQFRQETATGVDAVSDGEGVRV